MHLEVCEVLCEVAPFQHGSQQVTYSVAQPVFILVPGVAVVHVHAFALDGQALLKEDVRN